MTHAEARLALLAFDGLTEAFKIVREKVDKAKLEGLVTPEEQLERHNAVNELLGDIGE